MLTFNFRFLKDSIWDNLLEKNNVHEVILYNVFQ